MAGLLGATRASAAREEDRLKAMHEENKRLTLFGQAGALRRLDARLRVRRAVVRHGRRRHARRARRRLRWRTLPRSSRSRRVRQRGCSAAAAAMARWRRSTSP